MAYIVAIDQGITAGLAVFLVVLLFLLSRYPIRLPRNVVVHSFLFTAFFLSNSLTMLFRGVFGIKVIVPIDIGLTVIATACSLAWFWLLNPKGEEVTVHVAHPNSKREEHLLSQLNYLNQTLIKTGKS
jgi:hypothetical protein